MATSGDFTLAIDMAVGTRVSVVVKRTWCLPPEKFQPSAVDADIVEPVVAGHEVMPESLACRNAARNLFAHVVVEGRELAVASLHATPGSSRAGVPGRRHQLVHEWKPYFHGALAVELRHLQLPFVFAIDANEPLSETVDRTEFHWGDGRPGVEKLRALLGREPVHRARDLVRERVQHGIMKAESADVLASTYRLRDGSLRRFDQLWATPEFEVVDLEVRLADSLAAGSDHALTLATLAF